MNAKRKDYESNYDYKPGNPQMFDTYKAVKSLREKGGLSEKSAISIVEVVAESARYDLSNLATKQDVELVNTKVAHIEERMATKQDVELVEQKLATSIELVNTKIAHIEERMATKEDLEKVRVEMAQIHSSLIKWIIGMGVAITSIGAAAIGLLIKYLPVVQNLPY